MIKFGLGAALLFTSLSAYSYDAGDWRCGWKYTSAWTKGITYHWKYDRAYEGAFRHCMSDRFGNTQEFCEEAIVCRRVKESEVED